MSGVIIRIMPRTEYDFSVLAAPPPVPPRPIVARRAATRTRSFAHHTPLHA